MEMNQSQRLAVPQQVAWEALNDTALLKQCIPGCESIEPDGENAYQLALTAAVGPVKARFKGRMALQDIQRRTATPSSSTDRAGQPASAKDPRTSRWNLTATKRFLRMRSTHRWAARSRRSARGW